MLLWYTYSVPCTLTVINYVANGDDVPDDIVDLNLPAVALTSLVSTSAVASFCDLLPEDHNRHHQTVTVKSNSCFIIIIIFHISHIFFHWTSY